MQTPTFEPLATIDDNTLIPQLEYIVKCWDAIYSCGPEMAGQFLDRYNYGYVEVFSDKFGDYCQDDKLQTLIQDVYCLDPEKFWYLLLFASDISSGLGDWGLNINNSPNMELKRLVTMIGANVEPMEEPYPGFKFKDDPNMVMSLSVREKGRGKDTVVNIKNPDTFAYLAYLIENADKEKYSEFLNTRRGGTWGPEKKAASINRIAYFTQMMEVFLEPYHAKRGIVGYTIHTSKKSFISRCIYLMKLTEEVDGKFVDPLRPDFLKNYLKKAKPVYWFADNQHYFFDNL